MQAWSLFSWGKRTGTGTGRTSPLQPKFSSLLGVKGNCTGLERRWALGCVNSHPRPEGLSGIITQHRAHLLIEPFSLVGYLCLLFLRQSLSHSLNVLSLSLSFCFRPHSYSILGQTSIQHYTMIFFFILQFFCSQEMWAMSCRRACLLCVAISENAPRQVEGNRTVNDA